MVNTDPLAHGYGDPIRSILLSFPFIGHDRRSKLVQKWDEVAPKNRIDQFLRWYTRHDQDIIFSSRMTVVLLPLVLLRIGVALECVLPLVIGGLFLAETLARKREMLEREKLLAAAREEAEEDRLDTLDQIM